MGYTMSAADIITIDFETYWDSKSYTLSKMGPISYVNDKRFEAQLLGVRVNGGNVAVIETTDIPYVLRALELHKPGRVTIGHNISGFDGLVLAVHYGVYPHTVMDTMVAMRWCGLSRMMNERHATLTAFLKNGVKEAGTVISDGKHWPQDFTPEEREAFKRYCANDVLQCYDNFMDMRNTLTQDVYDACTMTMEMATKPYLRLDAPLLLQYAKEQDDAVERARADLQRIFSFRDSSEFLKAIRSASSFSQMLRQLGVEPPMKLSIKKTQTNVERARKEAEQFQAINPERTAEILRGIDAGDYDQYVPALSKNDLEFTALMEHNDQRVAQLVRTRLEHNSSIIRSRTQRFLDLTARTTSMPVMLNLMAAFPSRYTAGNSEGSSDGLNVQNLNKRKPDQLTLRRAIKPQEGSAVVAGDSSQVEARMLAYQAGEVVLLGHFKSGRDPYSEQAALIYNIPAAEIKAGYKHDARLNTYRSVGKKAVLSAGYGVGKWKFSYTLLQEGIHLADDIYKHHELAFTAHAIYRNSNPHIVMFWKTCQFVIEDLESGGSGAFAGPTGATYRYGMEELLPGIGKVPVIRLPTGYPLVYYRLRREAGPHGYEYVYDRPRGRGGQLTPTRIYGGALTENLIQGTAFQMLMWQGVNIRREGFPVICNIHDAWISVVPIAMAEHAKARIEFWMNSVPDWLPDFPVACEVKIGEDFVVA